MTEAASPPDAPLAISARILCVDDEPNILSSLRRLFRAQGYQVLTAESGKEGLEIIERENVDVVISDMRMPEMNGARFLEHVRERRPEALRLLLTGYADIQSILEAINRGEIYRYITKPWDDNDIALIVRHALERKALEEEKKRLEALTQLQNEELKELNAGLEAKVEQRTAELKKAHDSLIASNEKLKNNYLTSIKVFSNLIELRGDNLAGHSRRVADLARRIATRMGLDTRETQEIFIAGLLHNIGKIGFSDELLAMPVSLMNGDHLSLYRKYPIRGEQLLMPLDDLRPAARLVRSHQERFDGEGFPDRLSGFNIPAGARILALASDYDNLQIGTFAQRRLRPDEATALILKGRGKRYDPAVVNVFEDIMNGRNIVRETVPEEEVRVPNLRPGMVTSRDVLTRDGVLLLSADHALNERMIQQLLDFEASSHAPLTIYIRTERGRS
jgi:response regulator RpfG family c-di-GMP phosphodiesterase